MTIWNPEFGDPEKHESWATNPVFFDDFVWIPDGAHSVCGTIDGDVIKGFRHGTLMGRTEYTHPVIEGVSDARLFETAMTAEEIAAEHEAMLRLGADWTIEGTCTGGQNE